MKKLYGKVAHLNGQYDAARQAEVRFLQGCEALYLEMEEYLSRAPGMRLSVVVHPAGRNIHLSVNDMVFSLVVTRQVARRSVTLRMTAEITCRVMAVVLTFRPERQGWKISHINRRKLKYLMRCFDVTMLEAFLLTLLP